MEIDVNAAAMKTTKQLDKATTKAWDELRECQLNATELRKQWLQSKARYKAGVEGIEDAEKVMKIMVRNMEEKNMNRNLSYITKGAHERLPWIEMPTGVWYYSPLGDELYRYDKRVFESHAVDQSSPNHFHLHHTLKVIPDDAIEVEVGEEVEGYRVLGEYGQAIEWI